jgi:hypothetical protein
LVTVCKRVCHLLAFAIERQGQIPTSSLWFDRSVKYRRWYLTDYNRLFVASHTHTPLEPDFVADPHWLDRRLLDTVLQHLDDVASADKAKVVEVLDSLAAVAEAFGGSWQTAEAQTQLERVRLKVQELVSEWDDTFLRTAAIERIALLPLNVLQGLTDQVRAVEIETLARGFDRQGRGGRNAALRLGLPRAAVAELTTLDSTLDFDKLVGVGSPTPKWYLGGLVAKVLHAALQDGLRPLSGWLLEYYKELARTARSAEDWATVVSTASRGLTAAHRLKERLQEFEELSSQLLEREAGVPGPIAEINWEEMRKQANELRIRMLAELGASIVKLPSATTPVEEGPDFLGEAVHRVGHACFAALLEGKAEEFEALFAFHREGIVQIPGLISGDLETAELELKTILLIEPILDLLDLSGWTFTYSELTGDARFWDACKASWDAYLSESGDEKLRWISAALSIKRATFGIAPRDMLRSERKQQIARLIRELPRVIDRGPGEIGFSDRVDHDSPLIRRLGWSEMGSLDGGADIFAAAYLTVHPEAPSNAFDVDDLASVIDSDSHQEDES